MTNAVDEQAYVSQRVGQFYPALATSSNDPGMATHNQTDRIDCRGVRWILCEINDLSSKVANFDTNRNSWLSEIVEFNIKTRRLQCAS